MHEVPVDQEPGADLPHLPIVEATEETKPVWRGWIHAVTTPVALIAGIILIVAAETTAGKISSAVFLVSSLLLFGNSALYHRLNWAPTAKRLLKRIDHSNIFVLIAGTYTPVAVMALPEDKATFLLVLVWAGALLGIAFRVFWINAPRWLYVPLYVILGWAAMVFIVDLFQANAAMMTLVLIGGVFYTVGALVYGMKRPNPWPTHFGFHEIFHACTAIAFACQWTGILLIAVNPVS